MGIANCGRAGALGALSLLALTGALPPYAWSQVAPRPQGQNPNGMRIYIWGGLKTHSAGQHDYPQFLADWSKLLTERGAVVNGALHPPSGCRSRRYRRCRGL